MLFFLTMTPCPEIEQGQWTGYNSQTDNDGGGGNEWNLLKTFLLFYLKAFSWTLFWEIQLKVFWKGR